MFIIYDLIFLIFTIIYLPIYLCKRKFHRGFLLRLGILPKGLRLERPIWIHAVSVGEVMAIRGLLETLREIYPDKKFVLSTVTPTGNTIAKNIAKDKDFVTYLPLDFSFFVRGVIQRINPSLFIVAETEIWPNLITQLSKHKVPMVVVNARISDRSFRGYRTIKILLKPILNKINTFCVQSKLDAERLVKLGLSQNKIEITGNMKFDLKPQVFSFNRLILRFRENETLWVCGSTHPQEEGLILDTYKKLLAEFRDLRLLIAPRHPERAKEIGNLVTKYRFNPAMISQLGETTRQPDNQTTVFILDTIGQLLNYYTIADIVFVGGSLARIGGHNILEPALLGKPVLFGPHMFNFRDIAELFLKSQAGILVRNQQELQGKIKYLLKNPKTMDELSSRAKDLMEENRGASLRNVQMIKKAYAGISL